MSAIAGRLKVEDDAAVGLVQADGGLGHPLVRAVSDAQEAAQPLAGVEEVEVDASLKFDSPVFSCRNSSAGSRRIAEGFGEVMRGS